MDVELSDVASLLADRSRATFITALHEAEGLPLTDLAHRAGVSLPTASSHMGRLVAGGLVTVEPAGRHRYYRLSHPGVADAIESLLALADAPTSSRTPKRVPSHLAFARTCYDHLDGAVAVALAQSMLDHRWIERSGRATFGSRRVAPDHWRRWLWTSPRFACSGVPSLDAVLLE